MEEQTSWKGHTFTLMIFGGIVVLCSIFFVLGMLVGRAQSLKIANIASAEAAAKAPSKELPRDEPEVAVRPRSTAVVPEVKPAPAPVPAPPPDPPAQHTVSLQIQALKTQM